MHANVYAEARREYRVLINDSPPYCIITGLPTELEDHHFRQTCRPRRSSWDQIASITQRTYSHACFLCDWWGFKFKSSSCLWGKCSCLLNHSTPATRFPNVYLSLNFLKHESLLCTPNFSHSDLHICLFMFLGLAENGVKTERDKTRPNSWITGSASYVVCRSPRLKALLSNLSLNKASSELKLWFRIDSLKLQIRNCWCLKSGAESMKPEAGSNSLKRSEATLSSQVGVQFV